MFYYYYLGLYSIKQATSNSYRYNRQANKHTEIRIKKMMNANSILRSASTPYDSGFILAIIARAVGRLLRGYSAPKGNE